MKWCICSNFINDNGFDHLFICLYSLTIECRSDMSTWSLCQLRLSISSYFFCFLNEPYFCFILRKLPQNLFHSLLNINVNRSFVLVDNLLFFLSMFNLLKFIFILRLSKHFFVFKYT